MSSRIGIAIGTACVTALALSASAAAQDLFDFSQIPGVPEEPSVQIDLGPGLIDFLSQTMDESDPGTAQLISGLRGIQVRVYEELDDVVAVRSFVDDVSQTLEQQGWERVVYVRDGRDRVRVYARLEGGEMTGMTVFVVDSSEAVFINLAGRINPAQLGRLAAVMGMDDVLGFGGNYRAPARGAPDDEEDQ